MSGTCNEGHVTYKNQNNLGDHEKFRIIKKMREIHSIGDLTYLECFEVTVKSISNLPTKKKKKKGKRYK